MPVAPVRVADSLVFVRDQPPSTPVMAFPPAPDVTVGTLPPTLVTPTVPSGAPAPPGAAVASPATTAAPPPPTPAARTPVSIGAPTYTLYEGTVIETVLTNRLDGTFSGPVNCLVSVPVYAKDQLVIPAGARVLGEARAVNTFGQSRLAVTFHRVLLPNQTSVDLDEVPGLNQAGDLGLADQVNRHYAQVFGASLALGAIAGLAQAGTGYGFDVTSLDAYRQGIASNVSQSSTRVLDRFLNLLPTVTIREGHRIKVYLTRDLSLPAYRPAASAPGGRP
jgi:type IV secretion system protein VirB10